MFEIDRSKGTAERPHQFREISQLRTGCRSAAQRTQNSNMTAGPLNVCQGYQHAVGASGIRWDERRTVADAQSPVLSCRHLLVTVSRVTRMQRGRQCDKPIAPRPGGRIVAFWSKCRNISTLSKGERYGRHHPIQPGIQSGHEPGQEGGSARAGVHHRPRPSGARPSFQSLGCSATYSWIGGEKRSRPGVISSADLNLRYVRGEVYASEFSGNRGQKL